MKISLFILLLLASVTDICGQQKDYQNDAKSVDAIIGAVYAVISGEPGQARDWNRFRNLFKPETRLIPTRKNESGELVIRAMSPEEYIELFSSRVSTGFFEKELHRATESYGTVTHAFSTYETKEKKDGPVTNRGINSIQLFYDGHRYFIINIFWCAESLGYPLPEKYLK